MRFLAAVAIFFAVIEARAEYRVFQLVITDQTTGKARTVISNLDDLQYTQYHYVKSTESIAVQDTWMCWRRSDNYQPYCPNPRGPASAAPPSANSPSASTSGT